MANGIGFQSPRKAFGDIFKIFTGEIGPVDPMAGPRQRAETDAARQQFLAEAGLIPPPGIPPMEEENLYVDPLVSALIYGQVSGAGQEPLTSLMQELLKPRTFASRNS